MIIDALTALPSTPTTGDELPIERGTTTYKIDYDALATAIINKLGTVLKPSDVVNDLNSTATDKPLAAAQGKVLNDAIAQSTASVSQINGSAVTFNANESKSIVFDVSRSNYVPLGIVGINTTSTELVVVSFRINNNQAVVWCKNMTSASLVTGVPYIFVLYMPS